MEHDARDFSRLFLVGLRAVYAPLPGRNLSEKCRKDWPRPPLIHQNVRAINGVRGRWPYIMPNSNESEGGEAEQIWSARPRL